MSKEDDPLSAYREFFRDLEEKETRDHIQRPFQEEGSEESLEDIFKSAFAEHLQYLHGLRTNIIHGVIVGQPSPVSSPDMQRYHVYVWNLLTSDMLAPSGAAGKELIETRTAQEVLSKKLRMLPEPIYIKFANVYPKDVFDLYERLAQEHFDIEELQIY